MLLQIYELTGMTAYFLLALMLSRYIFLLRPLHGKWRRLGLMTGMLAVCLTVCVLFGRTPGLVVLGILLGGYIFLTGDGNRRRYFRVLQVFPILGICQGLILPVEELPVMLLHLSETTARIYAIVLYSLLLLAMLCFALLGISWRHTFEEEMQYRHLEYWEKTLLYVIGMLMFLFASPDTGYTQIADPSFRSLALRSTAVSAVICFIVTLSVIILILQGNRNALFREQVLQLQHNIIITLADIIENRDENTGGHIRRTAKYVEIIARTLKADDLYGNILTDQYITDMITAAPLHDIGKIHVPDAVLKKEGRFTDEEYAIMKKHCNAGRKLLIKAEKTLGRSSYLDIAVQMAACHHEWWNGNGYPEGLKGQDIPLCARIMAVADVFDALVSKRCYKEAMSTDEAYKIIRKESGTHFDPVVAEAFLGKQDEINAILAAFTDPEQPAPAEMLPES